MKLKTTFLLPVEVELDIDYETKGGSMPQTYGPPEACDPGDNPDIDVKNIEVLSALAKLKYAEGATGSFDLVAYIGLLEGHLEAAYKNGEAIQTTIDEVILEAWVLDYGQDNDFDNY